MILDYRVLIRAFIQFKNTGVYEIIREHKVNEIFKHSIQCYKALCSESLPIITNPLENVKIENVSKIMKRDENKHTYCNVIFRISLLFYIYENYRPVTGKILRKHEYFHQLT